MPHHIIVTVQPSSGIDWSAWVSAGAAVVQAIAAGLAIWYSGKLARESAAREIAAERAATARADAAETASQEREAAAVAGERQRVADAEREAFNEPLDAIIEVGEAAALAFEQMIEAVRQRGPEQLGYPELPAAAAQLPNIVPVIRERVRAPQALHAATALVDAGQGFPLPFPQNAATLVTIYTRRLEALRAAVEDIRAARRG